MESVFKVWMLIFESEGERSFRFRKTGIESELEIVESCTQSMIGLVSRSSFALDLEETSSGSDDQDLR